MGTPLNPTNPGVIVKKRVVAATILLSILTVGCAAVDRRVPAYPARGQSVEQYQADIAHCKSWAENNAGSTERSAVGGAATGAVVVGGIGAAFGAVVYALMGMDPGEGAMVGAALGGLTGAVSGAAAGGQGTSDQQNKAYSACMLTRGYTVIP